MPKEIERKFLVATDGWRQQARIGSRFRQAIVLSQDDRSARVRVIDDAEAKLTIKIGTGMTRHEFEYPIPIDEARELLALASGTTIEKVRYQVAQAPHVWEIDVYEGVLAGLVVAEIELADEAEQPALPSWLGREVTGDHRFSNQALAEGSLGGNWRDAV